jgi:hypothetical protein
MRAGPWSRAAGRSDDDVLSRKNRSTPIQVMAGMANRLRAICGLGDDS